MKINYFFRQFHPHQISIEKLFDVIIREISKKEVTEKVVNPYGFSLSGIIKALKFFKSHPGEINHITGDIHWAALALPARNTVLTVHDLVGLNTMTGIKKKLYFEFWVKKPFRKLRYITVISEKTKQEIITFLPEVKDKISVIPNCLTTELSLQTSKKMSSKPEVLIVGTRSNKNIERTLAALKGLAIHLTIIDEISDEQGIFLKENSFDFDQYFNVSDEELISLYQKADVLTFVSLYEGFGLPILEAQAQNCVVITSNISPMKEVAGTGAILVNPESNVEINAAIKKVLENEDLRFDLQKKGMANVKNYLPQKIANQYVELYKKILEKQ